MKEARSKNRRIIIVPPDSRLLRGLLARGNLSPGARWIYLGRDPLFHLALTEIFESCLDEIPIGERLQALARETRSDYIEYIGELSSRSASLPWWFTSVSEKNPFVSRLFLHSCYLRIFMEDLRSGHGDRVIIGETSGLRRALERNARAVPARDLELREPPWPALSHFIGRTLLALARKSWFIASMTARILISRWFTARKGRESLTRDGVIIFSWADRRSFAGSTYTDVYGGVLGEELRRRGMEVRYLVSILPTMPSLRGLRAIRRFGNEAILLEEFLRPTDPLNASLFVRMNRIHLPDLPPMSGMDLQDIVQEDLRGDHFGTAAEKAYLVYLAGASIVKHLPHALFIHPFENHAWEKMFSASLKRDSSPPKVIGYAHSIVIPMYTCYSLSMRERGIAPGPDLILVNGPTAKSTLIRSGFEEERILVVGSFRYPSLAKVPPVHEGAGGKHLLVALSPDLDEALELVYKTMAAFRGSEEVAITIKRHPITPPRDLMTRLPSLPLNFAFSDEPIESLLARADLVLYTVSTVSVEAIARGIPVVHVKSSLTIDRNIFEGIGWIPSVMDPEDLKATVLASLRIGRRFGERERKVIADLFSPVDGKILDGLVEGRVFPFEGHDRGESGTAGGR